MGGLPAPPVYATLDANEAAARIAYALNEVIALYPITPASPMGEWADQWAARERKNLWGTVPAIVEMQSEGGAAGVLHGALQTGSLCTTFTASQGLLLMIPNMYKIAGELTPTVFHVAARSLATHALSIFGDHSDVMAARSTGWAMLGAASVQEAQDFALIAQAATLEARIPFVHFFDGFRTSHEINKIALLDDAVLRGMVDESLVIAHRHRALSPDHPVLRGTAQNPDVFFQGREAANPFYEACPSVVQRVMDRFASLTGRAYRLFDYYGHPEAEQVVILMGSASETIEQTVDRLTAEGRKVGVVKVRLFRPFDVPAFLAAIPPSVRAAAVLDRSKEPGAAEPLYLDCAAAFYSSPLRPRVVGGRYGLSSKEFTPAMAKAVFDNLHSASPKSGFTVGITDDVTHHSLPCGEDFDLEPPSTFRALFYGLGSDGTVGANKDSIHIIGEHTSHFVQGYFVYDSKKSGAATVSHLRIGAQPLRSPYLISKAHFVACHHPSFLAKFDLAGHLLDGGTLLLNSSLPPERLWASLPAGMQETLRLRKAHLYAIDAGRLSARSGLPGRINVVMQVCFFFLAKVLPPDDYMPAIKESLRKTYAKQGEEIVARNLTLADQALLHLHEVPIGPASHAASLAPTIPPQAPSFVQDVLGPIIAGRGDSLPVSAFPPDGTFPTGTAKWEKRNLAREIPVWQPSICIQCGKCVVACPHAAIRGKACPAPLLAKAPASFQSAAARLPAWRGLQYSLQVAPEDCTGCGICVDVCPVREKTAAGVARALRLAPQKPLLETERTNWDFFLSLPDPSAPPSAPVRLRELQIRPPLFEFSGACSGCGETPYLKLLTQLYGDRLIIANATGCSSIYGGNLPTTPWTVNSEGRGPAWSNSLFEDNAEFGLGFRISLDRQREFASELLLDLSEAIGADLSTEILSAPQDEESDIATQRQRIAELKRRLLSLDTPEARRLHALADSLVRKSVWIVGGDGWAYDIGFGGLDHVLASGANVKVLVLDTEGYSNTGGQCSKATPRAAIAKFAARGKSRRKKDLGLIALTYGSVYVASVALGAKDEQTLKAFSEAEAFPGPALIIAYSHCIAHGLPMGEGMQHQRAAVEAGQWLLYRFDPSRAAQGLNPLQIDSVPKASLQEYLPLENRFLRLARENPDSASTLYHLAQQDAADRWSTLQALQSALEARRQIGNSERQANGRRPGAGL